MDADGIAAESFRGRRAGAADKRRERASGIDRGGGMEVWEEILKKAGQLRLRALGNSMFPWIRSGDVILIQPVEQVSITRGDVLLYRRRGRVYAHRFVAEEKTEGGLLFKTRGDYLSSPDPLVSSSDILGKVVGVERGGRIVRLDSHFRRIWARMLAVISPWLRPLLVAATAGSSKVLRYILRVELRLNRIGPFRYLKRKLFPKTTCKIATKDDACLLAKYCGADEMEISLAMDEGWLYCLAGRNGQIVGGLAVGRAWQDIAPGSGWWIMGLWVDPRYRGRGIGQGLVAKAIRVLKKMGIESVFVNVFEYNQPAIRLYRKLGFRPADMPEIEEKISRHYARVAPHTGPASVLWRRL